MYECISREDFELHKCQAFGSFPGFKIARGMRLLAKSVAHLAPSFEDEWMDGWMGKWMDGWVSGWMTNPSQNILETSSHFYQVRKRGCVTFPR